MKWFYLLMIFISCFQLSYAQNWSSVGTGVADISNQIHIHSLCVYNGELYAGGNFDTIDNISGRGIAKWNGISWDSVSSGMSSGNGADVRAFEIYNGELYAGGGFGMAGGIPANRIARWNGSNWNTVGSGILGGWVLTLTSFNGELYAGGTFTVSDGNLANYIERWNGTSWTNVGIGVGNSVNSSSVYNNELYVGGNWSWPGNHIAGWNGTSWFPLGTGLSAAALIVEGLEVYNGEIYAGGNIDSAGGIPVSGIARWNGASWDSVGAGLAPNGARAFCVYNGDLYVGGNFTTAGGMPVNNIARWNGTVWNSVGTGVNGWVRALAVYNGDLYVGGDFDTAGGVPARRIAKWNLPTKVEENNSINAFNIFPNPNNGNFLLQTNTASPVLFSIINILGEKICEQKLISEKTQINLSQQPNGIYFVQLRNEKQTITKKILLNK